MTQAEIQTLLTEASCLNCFAQASTAELIELALLSRISAAAGGTPGGADTQVQFNDGGAFGGDADFTWNKTTNLLSITGGIALTGEANETPLALSGYSLTGANDQSALSIAGTWNTTGTPTALDMNITDTASNALSLLLNLRTNGASRFSFSKGGILTCDSLCQSGVGFRITSGSNIRSDANGNLTLLNNAANDFGLLKFGGTTSAFPAFKRSTTLLQTRLADDSAYAPFEANTLRTATAYTVGTLPAAGTAGLRAYVTDANATFTAGIGAVVAAGGANVVPVFDDGVNWRIG